MTIVSHVPATFKYETEVMRIIIITTQCMFQHQRCCNLLQAAPRACQRSLERWWPTNWLKANSNHGAGSTVICFAPWTQCRPSVLLQGDLWHIAAYPGWAAVLFLQPWFKKRKRSLFSASCINQSLSPLPFLFGYGIGWVKSARTCISISRDYSSLLLCSGVDLLVSLAALQTLYLEHQC